MIAGTQSSGKWWNRQAEIERVVPDEVVIPKAEQYLQAHSVPDLGGQPYSVAMLGGRLSPVEIAKLKAQGILKAAQDLTPGGISARRAGALKTALRVGRSTQMADRSPQMADRLTQTVGQQTLRVGRSTPTADR